MNKLKELRIAANLSQRQLSDRTKEEGMRVPVRTIQMYEQQLRSLKCAQTNITSVLAKILNCDIADLYSDIENVNEVPSKVYDIDYCSACQNLKGCEIRKKKLKNNKKYKGARCTAWIPQPNFKIDQER